MKTTFLASLAALTAGFFAFSSPVAAQTPAYLEVVPFTIQWNRSVSAVTRTRTTQVFDVNNPADPDPIALITTDTVRTIRDLPIGTYSQLLIQINQGTPGPFLFPDWNFQGSRNIVYDLVAVRVPARTVAEFATNRYYIYLTATDRRTRVNAAPPALVADFETPTSIPVPTGLSLELGEYFARTTETFNPNGSLNQVSGTISTSFKIDFTNTYQHSPPSAFPRSMFIMNGRGTAVYTLRTIKPLSGASSPAFITSAATTLRGVGYYGHQYDETTTPNTADFTHLGLAPMTIVLGQAKFVSRQLFPDFPIPVAP